jgi:nucleoside-diphosphate-sugar epimerase
MPRWFPLLIATAFGILSRIDGYPPRVAQSSVDFYSHRVVFNIDKSKQLLGYAPRVSFEDGMQRTAEWLRSEKTLKKNDK